MSTPDFMEDPDCSKPGHEVAFNVPPRMMYQGRNFKADIVSSGDDLIYQFFRVKHSDFRKLLAEIIESHFGNTNSFSAATVPELKSLGVRAKGVTSNPFFNLEHYTSGFLDLVDNCLSEV
jgi:hypothetical protein